MDNRNSIGIFDSGIGGLTVVRELIRMLPEERFIYFGDTARIPYGPRPPAEIKMFMKQILDFFALQKVKLAVVACNTMTALALDLYQGKYEFPLVGMSTGAKEALSVTENKRIGVMATTATIASGKHGQAIMALDKSAQVYPMACPKLVPLIEQEKINCAETEAALKEYLLPFKQAKVDTVILGCTHYPFVIPSIKNILGSDISIVDPAKVTADSAKDLLMTEGFLSEKKQGENRFCFSADPELALRITRHLIKGQLPDFELTKIV